jgi:gamma-glutamylputrescine oxidase
VADYIDSYYSRTLGAKPQRPALDSAVSADVCIIGGGLAGLACALGLAERGKSVALLEGNRIGWGASGRNGGFVLAGFAAGPDEIAAKVGNGQARDMIALTYKSLELIRKRISDYNIACNPVAGHLRASWYDDAEAVEEKVEKMRGFGFNVEMWERGRVREACRTGRYYDGAFYPDFFHMHPLAYAHGIATAGEIRGVRIFEDSMALSVDRAENGFEIKTALGAVRAKEIVYCGSAYFNGLSPRVQNSCLPVATYVMVTQPLAPEKIASAITVPYAIRDDRWADDYYRILPDNRILWGGRVGLRRGTPKKLKEMMLGDMLKVYPQLEGAEAETAWSGLMGYTVHKMPLIRKLGDGVWCCTNFGGNGLGPTTMGGELIAKAIAERDETYKLFKPFGFKYTGGVLGPLVAQAAYHSWELGDRLRHLRTQLRVRFAV